MKSYGSSMMNSVNSGRRYSLLQAPKAVPEPEDADKPLEPKTPAAPAPQEETTPLQDYATYEATKDISDPNTAAVAGAAAAQVAGALQ